MCRPRTYTRASDDPVNPGWPPSRAVPSVTGQTGCRYEGGGDGPGEFSCDGWGSPVRCEGVRNQGQAYCRDTEFGREAILIYSFRVICNYGRNGNSRLISGDPWEDIVVEDEMPSGMELPEATLAVM